MPGYPPSVSSDDGVMLTPPVKPYFPPSFTIPPAPLSATAIHSGLASPLGWGGPTLQPPSTQPSLHLSPMPSPPSIAELSQPDSPVSYVVRSPPPIPTVVPARPRSCTPPPVIIRSRSPSSSPERVSQTPPIIRIPETAPKPAGSGRFPTVVPSPSFVPSPSPSFVPPSVPARGRRAFAMNSAVPPPPSWKPVPSSWRAQWSQPQQPGIIPPAPLTPLTRPQTIPPGSPVGAYPYDSWSSYYPAAAQPMPVPTLQPIKYHPRFYFPDGTLLIYLDDGTRYKVHRHFIVTNSPDLAARAGSYVSTIAEACPLHLSASEVDPKALDLFLSIFYPLRLGEYEAKTKDDWKCLLTFANNFSMRTIRDLCVEKLEPMVSGVEKVALAKECGILEWLLPAYMDLCQRTEPLTLEEGKLLGVEAMVKIGELKHEMQEKLVKFITDSIKDDD